EGSLLVPNENEGVLIIENSLFNFLTLFAATSELFTILSVTDETLAAAFFSYVFAPSTALLNDTDIPAIAFSASLNEFTKLDASPSNTTCNPDIINILSIILIACSNDVIACITSSLSLLKTIISVGFTASVTPIPPKFIIVAIKFLVLSHSSSCLKL